MLVLQEALIALLRSGGFMCLFLRKVGDKNILEEAGGLYR